MEDPKSFYDEERAREEDTRSEGGEPATEEAPRASRPTEEAEGTPYFSFDGAPEVKAEPLTPQKPNRSFGTIALVLAVLSFCCCGLPFSAAAIILAILDRRRMGHWEAMSVIALVIAIIGLVMSIVTTILSVVYMQAIWESLPEGTLPEGILPEGTQGSFFSFVKGF